MAEGWDGCWGGVGGVGGVGGLGCVGCVWGGWVVGRVECPVMDRMDGAWLVWGFGGSVWEVGGCWRGVVRVGGVRGGWGWLLGCVGGVGGRWYGIGSGMCGRQMVWGWV